MQKKLIVTSTELSSKKATVLFDGLGKVEALDEGVMITYLEKDKKTNVVLDARATEAYLRRSFEAVTQLHFDKFQPYTIGTVSNEFGEMELEIQTNSYVYSANVIAVEYTVLNGDEAIETYRVMWKIKDLNA